MTDFALFNDSFSITKTSTYHLAIQFSTTSYSYCVIDTVRRICVAVKHSNFKDSKYESLEKNLKFTLQNDAFLNKNYKSIDFVYISKKSTLVPKDVFEKVYIKNYFELNHNIEEFEELHYNEINETNSYNIFSIPSYITTLLVNHFPEVKFYHQSTILITNTFMNPAKKNNIIRINFNKYFFDIVVVINDKLILYNNYKYINENDFLFHVLNTVDKLKLSQSKILVSLSGDIDLNSKYHMLIQKYILNIKFSLIKNTSDIQYGFDEVPQHYLTNLITL